MDVNSYSPHVIQVKDAKADVWKFNMHMHHEQLSVLSTFLDKDEIKRYEQLLDIGKRRNNMACRGLLKLVLSLYTVQKPNQIHFSYSSYGKPYIVGQPTCFFNLSHSGNWLYIIVSQSHEVGIDCEMITDKNITSMASIILCPIDYNLLKDIPKRYKTKHLIQAWTQKEAFIKAIGKGLFYQSLKSIHVNFTSVHGTISNYYSGKKWITKTLYVWDDHIISICYKKGEEQGESYND